VKDQILPAAGCRKRRMFFPCVGGKLDAGFVKGKVRGTRIVWLNRLNSRGSFP
jgi:hypothetical protein